MRTIDVDLLLKQLIAKKEIAEKQISLSMLPQSKQDWASRAQQLKEVISLVEGLATGES